MATAANLPPGAMPVDENRNTSDPFLSLSEQQSERQRYAGFDNHLYSLHTNGSPAQAKRALEAHLSETERRLQDASHLGTVLVQQRKELADRLREVDDQQQQNEISPELKARLVELEREVSEVSRETARTFIPKTPRAGEDFESSEFFSQANHSPSKLHAPSRKQRNQQSNRVNDLKLATDISTSLLTQVRDLQTALAEKDDALKAVVEEKSELDLELKSINQRMRALNESEQRFKDENWSLETTLHDLTATHKQVADREQRVSHNLNITTSAKAALEREFEELKQAHEKLSEDHSTVKKQSESEIESLKRTATELETQRNDLEAKREQLISQNQELVQHIALRNRAESRNVSGESQFDANNVPEDGDTPDNSPPGSPSKATPRHGALQQETTQSALTHAHRLIQNLKNQLHREKTEKLEYRRLLQESRDETEARRNGVDSGKKRKSGKDQDLFKKPARPDRLGAAREGKDEIIIDDPDWEDHEGVESPSRGRTLGTLRAPNRLSVAEGGSDANVTATDHSDHFETANERETSGIETDAFQTGAETLDGDSGNESTEREDGPSTSTNQPSHSTKRFSLRSTASSDDSEDYDVRTPLQAQLPKYKIKVGPRGSRRVSERLSSDGVGGKNVDFRDSPASIASPDSIGSNSSTPAAFGQSLFAELENLSDAETEEGTPRSVNMLSPRSSPEIMRKSPAPPSRLRTSESQEEKPAMVDTGIMTEPWEPKGVLSTASEAIGAALAGGIGFGLGRSSKHTESEDSRDLSDITATDSGADTAQSIPPPEAPKLSMSSTVAQSTTPIEPVLPEVAPSSLQTSSILSQDLEPVDTPSSVVHLPLSQSAVVAQDTEPSKAVPIAPLSKPVALLTMSSIIKQETEPVDPPRPSTAIQTGAVSSTQTSFPEPPPEPAQTSKSGMGFFGSMLRRKKSVSDTAVAEDETSLPPQTPMKQEPESPPSSKAPILAAGIDERTPFRQIDGNAPPSPERKPAIATSVPRPLSLHNGSTQTALSSSEIDRMMKGKAPHLDNNPQDQGPYSPTGAAFEMISPRRSHSRDSVSTIERIPRRPGSSGSMRSRGTTPPPPLPTEARKVIAAAAQKTPGTTPAPATAGAQAFGTMGPPIMPASAYNRHNVGGYRPRTPNNGQPSPTTRERGTVRIHVPNTPNRGGAISPATTRRSSVSSFASELDARFNIRTSNMDGRGYDAQGTDPRMIQAITQTMIGEYLWKYTRKAGREEMSSTRHRRFFWVHPYTRTLYWSNQDPATAGRAQLKAKSVAIDAVRVVTDDNPDPPGIHRKSLVVITPGRSIKFTASTSQRHETWFNSLSYLLLKTENDKDEGGLTNEDVDEFNPGFFRSSSRMTRGSRASMSSYMSRATQRTVSPHKRSTGTVTPGNAQTQQAGSMRSEQQPSMSGRLSVLSGVFKSSNSISSRHSRQESSIYEHANSEVADSAEELRKAIEEAEKNEQLENVRACCDGKHDVASLSRNSRHSVIHRHSSHTPLQHTQSRSSSRVSGHTATVSSVSPAKRGIADL